MPFRSQEVGSKNKHLCILLPRPFHNDAIHSINVNMQENLHIYENMIFSKSFVCFICFTFSHFLITTLAAELDWRNMADSRKRDQQTLLKKIEELFTFQTGTKNWVSNGTKIVSEIAQKPWPAFLILKALEPSIKILKNENSTLVKQQMSIAFIMAIFVQHNAYKECVEMIEKYVSFNLFSR